MTKLEQAARQALDFIEQVDYPPYDDAPVITALREALAEQAEQPVSDLEQAAKNLLSHWDSVVWKQTRPTADFMADLREALDHSGEANEMVEFFSKEMKNKISVALAEQAECPHGVDDGACKECYMEQAEQEPSCNQHPDAPHGFARNASHNAGRYVCECEGWEPEQEPVAVVEITYGREPECYVTGNIDNFPEGVFKLYAAPVRTKDLTPDEIWADGSAITLSKDGIIRFARAVIASDREKNK